MKAHKLYSYGKDTMYKTEDPIPFRIQHRYLKNTTIYVTKVGNSSVGGIPRGLVCHKPAVKVLEEAGTLQVILDLPDS